MKKSHPTSKLIAVFCAALIPAIASANNSQDLVATGRIQLTLPAGTAVSQLPSSVPINVIPGSAPITGPRYFSNVSFTATVQGTTGRKIDGPRRVNPTASITTVGRIANAQVIDAALPVGIAITGFTLIVIYDGNLATAAPRLFAYRPAGRNNNPTAVAYEVDPDQSAGLTMDSGWFNFDGVYGGSGVISAVSPTASALGVRVSSGSLTGSSDYYVDLNINENIIPMAGVGSFTQNARGIIGTANLSGIFVP